MAADVAQHAEHVIEHAAPVAAHGDIPEIPNVITLLSAQWHDHPFVVWLHQWENLIFALFVAGVLCAIAWRFGRRPKLIPVGGQNLLELLVEGVDRFVRSVMGPAGRQHTAFIGTLFLYIWFMNLSVLIPGLKSSTSSLNTTVGLAFVVFCYVQWTRIKTLGVLAYLDHMAGSPRFDDVKAAPMWLKPILLLIKLFVMAVLFVLELVGEVVKPISLSLRLGFNIFAEDVLLAVLLSLGLAAGFALPLAHGPFTVGLPFQVFVVPLVLIFSTVQALVFSLLSSVYIALMQPHEAHHETASHH